MRIRFLMVFYVIAVVLTARPGHSQVDEAVSAGRYQIKNPSEVVETAAPVKEVKVKPKKKKRVPSQAFTLTEAPRRVVEKPAEKPPEKPPEKPTVSIPQPTVAEQVQSLVTGDNEGLIETYKEQIHPDDLRHNRIELSIFPGFLYNDSKSNFSYRNYNSFSPYLDMGSEIWLTPFLGVYAMFGTSIGADVASDNSTNSHVLVKHEQTKLGLDFRKYFGLSRKATSLEFGLHYFDYKFTVPGDEYKRVKTQSAGVGIHFKARFPVAPTYAWIIGGKIEPRLAHTEIATAINLQSGNSPESSRVGVNFGGEFKLSRQNQIIWDLAADVEKNQYSGTANKADPETNVAPSGVTVTNTFILFTLGYRWGH